MKKKLPEPLEKVRAEAQDLLDSIRTSQGVIDLLTGDFNTEVDRLKAAYEDSVRAQQALLDQNDKALLGLMKANKAVLFDGTDIVQLIGGTLIRQSGDKVTIPKTALGKCKELGFSDVVKVVESLDRDAIEKWPDERLFLIGAVRKPAEKFDYEISK